MTPVELFVASPATPRIPARTSRLRSLAALFAMGLVGLPLPTSAAALAAQQPLAARLTKLLGEPPLDRNIWGIAVLDGRGRMLYGRNSARLFMPASNAKLVVTAIASARLPSHWTVRTSAYAAGPVVDGVLQGDLVIYGRGDPTWGATRCFAIDTLPAEACDRDAMTGTAALASTIAARGIRRIDGDVVGDGSYFEPATIHPTWENDDLIWAYAAPVSGLGFHENTIEVTIRPGDSIGAAAAIEVQPDFPELGIENRTTTISRRGGQPVRFERPGDGWRIVVTGTVRRRAPDRVETLAAPDGPTFAAMALRHALVDSGIAVSGRARGTTDTAATASARVAPPLAEQTSRPLEDWIFPILNVSQNWYAETLLKHLGKQFGQEASWRAGLAVERRYLIDSVGVDSTQFLLHDGSGLSAKNLISPLALAKVLAFIRNHPGFAVFAAGLPRAGQTGSLRYRFDRTAVERRVRAKTGSIGQVNTLSGYIEREPGPAQTGPASRIFSIQANHHTLGGRGMIRAIDSIVTEIAAPSRPSRSRR